IYDRLQRHFGHGSVFMDVDTIPVGADFRQYLRDAVSQCEILLAIIGEQWLEASQGGARRLEDPKDFVRIELETALGRGIPVIPVLIGRTTMPLPEQLPPSLADLAYLNAVQVARGRDFHDHVDRLIQGLNHVFEHRKADENPSLPEKLQHFGFTETERDRAID